MAENERDTDTLHDLFGMVSFKSGFQLVCSELILKTGSDMKPRTKTSKEEAPPLTPSSSSPLPHFFLSNKIYLVFAMESICKVMPGDAGSIP